MGLIFNTVLTLRKANSCLFPLALLEAKSRVVKECFVNSGKEGRDTVVVMQMYSQGPLLSVAHPGPKLAAEEISP